MNKEQVTKQWKKYYYANREAILKRKKKSNKTYISKHKKEILKRNKQYYQKNKEKISKESKTRYQKNKEHISIKGAEYRRLNKEKIKERDKKNYHKYKLNPKRKIANNLRRRLRQLLTENDYSLKMIKLLGCSIDDFKKHLSNNFQEGMTFENYGKWHIDHIIPCRLFDLSKPGEQMICFNYKNLQPLWAIDNLKKSSSGTRQLNFLQSL